MTLLNNLPKLPVMPPICQTLVCALALTCAGWAAAADNYFFDKDHTEIRFYYSHGGVSEQSGEFTDFEGELIFDQSDPTANSVSVTIKSASINTGIRGLDGQLKNPYYFSVKEHPFMTFESSGFTDNGDGKFEVPGMLTIRGIAVPVTLDAEIRHQGEHPLGRTLAFYRGNWLGIRAQTLVMRSAFDMTSFVPVVSDEIRIEINAELKARSKQN